MAGEPRVISVVEDEPTIREAVCFALRREGFMPEAYGDGAAAWEAFARALPDLVLLDIGLPRVDGLELCRRLRGRSAALPIIFVTSREEEFDRVLGLEIGAVDYLCKPFSMRELMARVRVLLRRADLRDPAVQTDASASPSIRSAFRNHVRDRERLSSRRGSSNGYFQPGISHAPEVQSGRCSPRLGGACGGYAATR